MTKPAGLDSTLEVVLPNLHLRHSSQTAAATQRSVVTTPRRRGPRPDVAASRPVSPTWVSPIPEDKRHSQQLSITRPIGSEWLTGKGDNGEGGRSMYASLGRRGGQNQPADDCDRLALADLHTGSARDFLRRHGREAAEAARGGKRSFPHLPCGSRSTSDALSTGRDGRRRECLAWDRGGNESRRRAFNPTRSVSGLSRRIRHAAA
jgi:hypothetical protein